MVDMHGKLTQEVINASKTFNAGLLHAHAGGIGDPMSVRMARATMVTRLNALLNGGAGVQPSIIDAYVALLNKGITPVIPENGSIGEGDVYYKGKKIAANAALKESQTQPIVPYAKDALSILSSNAYSAAAGALTLDSLSHFIKINALTFTLSLQALNGNVSPFLENTLTLRPYPEVVTTGKQLRELLKGSSLWQHDATRPLQDPLSFRSGVYLLAELQRSYQQAYNQLVIQLNSSDDNPGVVLDVTPPSDRQQETIGYVSKGELKGAVLPGANFEPLPWVLAFEQLGVALAHNSLATAQQLVKLNNPAFTGLTRFLGTENTVHAFGAMEKPVMMLAMRNKELAIPVSMDYLPVAGEIEDIATNAPSVVARVQQQVNNSYQLLPIVLVHDAQTVDLRRKLNKNFVLSKSTENLYNAIRKQVPFMDADRALAHDFITADKVLRQYSE